MSTIPFDPQVISRYIAGLQIMAGFPEDGDLLRWSAASQQWQFISKDQLGMICVNVRDAGVVWANMPAALTEFIGSNIARFVIQAQLYDTWQIQVCVSPAGVAGSKLGVQASDDNGVTWRGIDNYTAGVISDNTVAIDGGTGLKTSSFADIHPNFKISNLLVRVVGQDGNGVADPAFVGCRVMFR